MYTIMMMEDDEVICKELSVLLQKHGYRVVCWDMKEDIQAFMKQEEPHIVLLDINFPDTDGFAICTQIRCFSKIPILFVTSRNSDMDGLCSLQMGGDGFISKPYNTSILLVHIAALLKRCYEWKETSMTHHDVTLDVAMSRIQYRNAYRELTKNEVKILCFSTRGKSFPERI